MSEILQLKIGLQGLNTWQKIFIESDATFQDLHKFVQEIYEWEDHHLHEFLVNDEVRIAPADKTDSEEAENEMLEDLRTRDDKDFFEESEISLSQYLQKRGDSLVYRYDFGNDRRYNIVLEKMKDREYIQDYEEFPVKVEDNF